MKKQKVQFKNNRGETLDGELNLPATRKPHNYVVFAHCFTCNKQYKSIREINRELTVEGYGVLKFDFTGLGESEGEFEESNFSGNVEDLISAAQYLENNYSAPTLLVGHSLGGAATLIAGGQLNSVKAIATIGAPFDPEHIKNVFQAHIDEIKSSGRAEVKLAGRPFTITKQFVDDLEAQKVVDRLKSLNKSLLILHSPQDDIVGIENAKQIYENAMHPKSFVSLDGADHLMSNEKDARYAGRMIASWASNYLKVPDEDEELRTDQEVVVELCREDNYTTEVQAGNHHFLADEPKSAGGNDLGPTPYELLNAGLGTCTAMTLHMYARRKEWGLESVRVHLAHEKTHKEDSDNEGKLDEFIREIELEGDLDEKQRQRLLEIANKCPVHKTMSKGVHISTDLINRN